MSEQADGQNPPRVEFQVHFQTGHRGRRHLRRGANSNNPKLLNEDLPRLTRLLALAHRWNRLIEEGTVADRTEIARTMELSRARITQIMDLLYLAPEIQEYILFFPGRSKLRMVPERAVRSITCLPIWKEQCKAWKGTIGDD
ncbi:MAG: hypothetical protein GTO29_13265 [Candidatus Latescibacteria bacterium]|nr:hypothetical protein [Candidatus Latescibacterota bacterium]NIO56565.1 hypothetical protein [Candidatus Latescibacterota bacterium]